MIKRLVGFALGMPAIVLIGGVVILVAGLYSYRQLDIEAYPNPVPPLVEVITQPEGWSAEEVERYVTVPLEIGLSGMPGLDHIRSQSLFGLSDVKCYFKWGIEYKDARQEVINRLQFVQLPNNLQAKISPWNAIGEVFRYFVRWKDHPPPDREEALRELKTAEDWILEKEFKQVPGVVDVVSFGGLSKEYHVEVDPYRLRGRNIALPQLIAAVTNANQNVGGQRLAIGEQSYTVRGIGLFHSLRDIGDVVLAEQKGVPIRLRDVARTLIGQTPRLGLVGHDDEPDVVQGIVLMRYGGETSPTLDGIYDRIERIRRNHLLPPGIDIEPYYDRGKLVHVTTHTVMENLLVGMGLVTIVLFLFLGSVRAALVTAINIPLALLIAFSGMIISGTPANLISLGAVDFGIVIDSTVIMVENVFRHLGGHGQGGIKDRILAAAGEVGGPMAFSTLIIAVAFLPLFTMTGVSGVIFSPMAHTYAFAIGGAILLALTLTPVVAARALPATMEEKENALMRFLHRIYNPVAGAALRHPRLATVIGLSPIALCIALFPLLGGEFMPKLEEGNLWIRATLPMSVSLEQSSQYVGRMRGIVRAHPEVTTVVSQLGRPDDGTDVSGFFNVEIFAPLAPLQTWKRGMTKDKLTDELSRELESAFPGVIFNFSQMISDNVEEALSGVKAENSVKVVGPDLKINEQKADEISDVLATVHGVKDLGMFRSLGQPSVKIVPDRERSARYGLNTGDVEAVIAAAVGGQAVTQVYEGEKRFDLTVRWLEPYRNTVRAIRQITIATPDGTQIPLGQLADITEEEGPSVIYREDGFRYTPVKFSIRGRDLSSTIKEAQSAIANKVHLPYDTHIEWAGEINELKEAMGRLVFIIPLTLILIGILVYTAVRNWIDTLLVILSIPVACTGGMLALLVTRVNFSVSAAMGFISIFGIAIQDAILVVTYAQRLWADGKSLEEGAAMAAEKRFRPVLMTTLVAMVGLLPAAISNGIGAQTQKPLAIVVIGGAAILAILSRILRPPMIVLLHRRFRRATPA
jgi:cobalt-zinc-cadmium resistance protein CzcA